MFYGKDRGLARLTADMRRGIVPGRDVGRSFGAVAFYEKRFNGVYFRKDKAWSACDER